MNRQSRDLDRSKTAAARGLRAGTLALLMVCPALAAIEQPNGYRLDNYDAPVPERLDGATTVGAAEVKRLQQTASAIVIDVIPAQRRPSVLPANQIWIPIDHQGIAGALWLPDTGYGALSEVTEKYFKRHLRRATAGNKAHPLVFYCRADCWMSWNAARRALTYGYTRVYWFDDGIDGWLLEDYEFEVLTPAEGRRHAGDTE